MLSLFLLGPLAPVLLVFLPFIQPLNALDVCGLLPLNRVLLLLRLEERGEPDALVHLDVQVTRLSNFGAEGLLIGVVRSLHLVLEALELLVQVKDDRSAARCGVTAFSRPVEYPVKLHLPLAFILQGVPHEDLLRDALLLFN